MPQSAAARLCHHDRASLADGHCGECHQGPLTEKAHPDEDEGICRSYSARLSRCLRCGDKFQSYDPRYNRRCPSCQARVVNTNDFNVDDEYQYWP